MAQPKRKPAIQPNVSQEDYLRSIGASVPVGAPGATQVVPMAGLTPDDYRALGIDPNTLEGERDIQDTFVPGMDLQAFEDWKARNAPNDSGYDYDLKGAFVNGEKPAANGHWSDQFKKTNHPTFSDESQYANMPGADPGHWVGLHHDQFVPGAFAKADAALNSDVLGNYGQIAGDTFLHGTHQVAKGYEQALDGVDANTALGGVNEATRNDIGNVSGNLRKHGNRTLNAAANIGNGLIAGVYSPIAPVFHPVMNEAMDQFSRGPAQDPDKGHGFVQGMADLAGDYTGMSPDAAAETAMNVAMFGHELPGAYRAGVSAGHAGMDALEDGVFRGYGDLFPELRAKENRTGAGLVNRAGNAMAEAFGVDPAAPSYAAPWVKPGVNEHGVEVRPLSHLLPDAVNSIPALDNVPLPSWLRNAPRAQGELSPWLDVNSPHYAGSNGGNVRRPSSVLEDREGNPGQLSDVPELGDWVPEEGGVNAAYSQLVNQDWGGFPDAATRIREQQGRYDAERAQTPRTTLADVPSINSNQGDNGSVFDPNSSTFFSNLMREADRRDAAPEFSMDDHVDTANQNLAALANGGAGPIRLRGFGPDSQPVRLTPGFGGRPSLFRPGDDVDQAHWNGVADRQNPNAHLPDWEAHGIGPDDPARQAYERARAGQMRQEARTRFYNEDGSLVGSQRAQRAPEEDVEALDDYNARMITRQDERAGLPDLSKLDDEQAGRDSEYNRRRDVFGNYDLTRPPDPNSPYANDTGRLSLTDPEDIARYDYLRTVTDPWRERNFDRGHPDRDRLSPQGQRDHDVSRDWTMNRRSLNDLENSYDRKATEIRREREKYRDRMDRKKDREAGIARRAALGDKVNEPPKYDGKNTVTFGDGGMLVRIGGEDGQLSIGGTRSQQFIFSHPDLPEDIEIELDTLRSGKTHTTIMGDADKNAGVLGHTIIRKVARALKEHFGTNRYEGVRATGIRAGKGITQRTSFANGGLKPSAVRKDALYDEFGNPLDPEASVRDTAAAAIRGSGKPKAEGDVTTLPDGSTFTHISDIMYSRDKGLRRAVMDYKKPGMKNPVEVMLTVGEDGAGHIDILGDNDHIGAFGPKNVKEAARWLRQEYGVTRFEGWRTKRSDWDEDKQMQSLPATRFANGGGEKPSVIRQRELDQKGENPAGFETPDVEGGTVREAALQALRDQRLAAMDAKQRKGINPKRLPASEEAALGTPIPQKRTGGTGRGKSKAQDGIMATPNLRDMTMDEALAAVDRDPHLIQDKTGQYIGGPRGLKTRKQLMAMRKKFDDAVDRGLAGANWYQRARDMNTEINSGAERQSMASKEQAHTSAQAAPDPNFNWALQLRNDYEAGVPANRVRTGRVADSYMNARARGGRQDLNLQDILGKKTGIYGEHLDPNQPFATTGTNDIHHARQFGYTNSDGSLFDRALTEQEHRFLDYETILAVKRARARHLGGRTDWNAAEIQAAPWTTSKGELIAERSNGKITPEQGREMAGKTYPDFLDKYTANVTGESWPSQGMQLFPEWDMSQATPEERRLWDQQGMHYDEGGRDPIYSQTFGINVRPTQRTVGSFEGQNNPVDVARPLVHFENEGGKPTVGKSAKNMLNMDRAAAGLMDTQDGSAWHKIVTQGPGSDKSSLSINMGRVPNTSEMQALEAIASKYGFGLANANNGVSFLDFSGASGKATGKKLTSGMKKEIEAVVGPAQIQRGRFEGGYHDLSSELKPENQGQGLATQKTMAAIDEAGANAPNAKNALLHSKAAQAKAASNLKRILETEATRGPAREDVKKLLGILSKGGWKALYDHVQQFGTKGLPAVALPLLLQQGAGKRNERQTVDMSAY